MRKALTVAIIAVMLFGSLALLPAPARAETTLVYHPKKVLLLWNTTWDNDLSGASAELHYLVKSFLDWHKVPYDELRYDGSNKPTSIDTANYSMIIVLSPVREISSISAIMPDIIASEKAVFFDYSYAQSSWDDGVQTGKGSDITTGFYIFTYYYSNPYAKAFRMYTPDADVKKLVYSGEYVYAWEYKGNIWAGQYMHDNADPIVCFNIYIILLFYACQLHHIPVVPLFFGIDIDDFAIPQNKTWNGRNPLYPNAVETQNISKELAQKYRLKILLPMESKVTPAETIKAIKSNYGLYPSLHEQAWDFDGSTVTIDSVAAYRQVADAQMNKNFTNWIREYWVLPKHKYNENLTIWAANNGIKYLGLFEYVNQYYKTDDHWGDIGYNLTQIPFIKPSKNYNDTTYDPVPVNLYVVTRLSIGSLDNLYTKQMVVDTYNSETGGTYTYNQILTIRAVRWKNLLAHQIGPYMTHELLYAGEQPGIDLFSERMKFITSCGIPYIGMTGLDYGDWWSGYNDISYSYFYNDTKGAYKLYINNTAPLDHPVHIAIPIGSNVKISGIDISDSFVDGDYLYLNFNAKANTHYTITVEKANKANYYFSGAYDEKYGIYTGADTVRVKALTTKQIEIPITPTQNTMVKDLTTGKTVSWEKGSVIFTAQAGHTYEIYNQLTQAINISIDWTYAIVNAMIPIAIFAVLLSALTQILQAVRKSVRFRK